MWTALAPAHSGFVNVLRRSWKPFLLLRVLAVALFSGVLAFTNSIFRPDVLGGLQQTIVKRSEIDIREDFRGGLDSWKSDENLINTWSYDRSGLVIPGRLALLTPSMPLNDYNIDSRIEIMNSGIGLAFRAADFHTYEAMRLISEGSGPSRSIIIERYTVTNDKISAVDRAHVSELFQRDTLYRIHLEVHGNACRLYIQERLITSWSNVRTRSGGVGFFCRKNERARIALLRISHNTDIVGKLCALITSYM